MSSFVSDIAVIVILLASSSLPIVSIELIRVDLVAPVTLHMISWSESSGNYFACKVYDLPLINDCMCSGYSITISVGCGNGDGVNVGVNSGCIS